MNPMTYILITAAVGAGGVAVGYFLKLLLTLAQKGSMENKIKQAFWRPKTKPRSS